MSSPLRAFFMLFPTGEIPSISVFSDLKKIVRSWDSRESSDTPAVLHIGFDRIAARHFADIARRFPGKMLLTGGAKGTLPSAFTTSAKPVAEIQDIPVFYALSGWGYSDDDPTLKSLPSNGRESEVAASTRNPKSPNDSGQCIWIQGYLATAPDDAQKLRECGVFDDETYIENEQDLPVSVRKPLGQFRFNHLILGNSDDPCAAARFAPPWLQTRAFETLPISVRVSNVLAQKGIARVIELADLTLTDLLGTQNFGRSSVQDLLHALNQGLADGPKTEELRIAREQDVGFFPGLFRTLGSLPERNRDIIEKRMGLHEQPMTLEEIGAQYGITRERIRQLESKTVTRIIAEEIWDDMFERKLVAHLQERTQPLPFDALEIVDDWFSGATQRASVFAYWLKSIPSLAAFLIRIEGVDYIASLDQEAWEKVVREAKALLQGGVELGWSEEQCRQYVDGLLVEKGRELRHLLWETASSLCHFAGTDEGKILQFYGRGAEKIVLAVMEESECALHYSDLTERVNERAEQAIDIRRVHKSAANVGLLLGRGIYGLRQHIDVSAEEFDLLGYLAADIVLGGSLERQWHASEILGHLADHFGSDLPIADQYVVNAALKDHESVEDLGRLVWRPRSRDEEDQQSRIDIRHALLLILEDAAHPLPAKELQSRLNNFRGTSRTFQIVPSDPLIRVGTSMWGINDRDVPIKRKDQPLLVKYAKSILEELGHGIHISEVKSHFRNLPEIDSEALFGILNFDHELRISVSRHLFLANWESPRRLSLPEALNEVLEGADTPMNFNILQENIEKKMGRSCERTAISNALQGTKAVQNEPGMWQLSG